MVWFTAEAIEGWQAEPCTTPGGQPWCSPLAIQTALTFGSVFRLPLRQTEGLIGSIIGLLGLALAVPDHSTLSRRAKTLEAPPPQRRWNGGPMHLLADSTGLRLCGAGEWLLEKHGTKTRWSWRKLHIGLDVGSSQIAAASLTTKEADLGAVVDLPSRLAQGRVVGGRVGDPVLLPRDAMTAVLVQLMGWPALLPSA